VSRSVLRVGNSRSVEILGLLPAFGAESEDVARGVVTDADQDIAQVVERVHADHLARGDERVEDAAALRPFLAPGKEPVFSTMRTSA
jgi:hypothetical protein